jgi:hypothetical protein
LEDGRTLPVNYKHFDHGYAVTARRSQGKSVDAVVISGGCVEEGLVLRSGFSRQGKCHGGHKRQGTVARLSGTVWRAAIGIGASPAKWEEKGLLPSGLPKIAVYTAGWVQSREMALKAARQERESITRGSVVQQQIESESPTRDRGLDRGQDYGFGR